MFNLPDVLDVDVHRVELDAESAFQVVFYFLLDLGKDFGEFDSRGAEKINVDLVFFLRRATDRDALGKFIGI